MPEQKPSHEIEGNVRRGAVVAQLSKVCIAELSVPPEILGSSPGAVAASRNRETLGAVYNWPRVVRVKGELGW